MSYTKIKSVEDLKSRCYNEMNDFFIYLGIGRSSKDIYYDSDLNKFEIHNNIDDTEQLLTEGELFTKSNIGEAITRGNFYKY